MPAKTPRTPAFDQAFNLFLLKCQILIGDHYMTSFPSLTVPNLEPEEGLRYIRIWSNDGNGRNAYAFIDKTNGDILKPATWKAPAKHARGNIYAADAMSQMSSYGPAYLR